MGKKIRDSHLEDWLLKQDVYTLYRTAPVRFKRNKILVHGIDKQFQADLVDMGELADQNDDVIIHQRYELLFYFFEYPLST